jgi:hypothetical protein
MSEFATLPATAATLDPLAVAAEISATAPLAPSASAPAPSAPPPPYSGPVPSGTLDKRGVPFDPARHLPKMHPRHGGWLPRPPKGVAKRKGAATAEAASPSPSSTASPAPSAPNSSPASETASPGATPAAEPSPWTEADRRETSAPAPAPGEPSAPRVAAEPTPEADAQANIAAEGLETITGFFTGVPDEARMSAADRAAMARVLARWFQSKGWIAVGGFMVGLMVLSFFMKTAAKTKTREKLREMWRAHKTKEKPAPPADAPRDVSPGSSAPAPSSEASARIETHGL